MKYYTHKLIQALNSPIDIIDIYNYGVENPIYMDGLQLGAGTSRQTDHLRFVHGAGNTIKLNVPILFNYKDKIFFEMWTDGNNSNYSFGFFLDSNALITDTTGQIILNTTLSGAQGLRQNNLYTGSSVNKVFHAYWNVSTGERNSYLRLRSNFGTYKIFRIWIEKY